MGNCLVNTTENFFICTNIPIRTYRLDGTSVYSAGYDEKLGRLFSSEELFIKAKAALLKRGEQSFVSISLSDNTRFAASTICSCGIGEGFFLVGPYIIEKVEGSNIIYKPENCIPHIISLLHSIYRDASFPKIKFTLSKEPYSYYVTKALKYINKNYKEPISLEDVSNHLDINKCYFCSLFKNETGKTYSQYLNELRIEKSKELILKENVPLLEIALAVGFNNQNYFNMTFKKLTNMTPMEFRNNGRINEKNY
jgi:AraC-like DNA-binding protein